MTSLVDDLRFRGLIHQLSDDALVAALDSGHVVAYVGFDPTSDSLQIGNLLQLCNLRRLQLAGHQPIALAGGATGMIGDPGGKSEERPLLERAEIEANLVSIRSQMERFLDFSPEAKDSQALLLDNADWLADRPLIEFLRDVGKHFTVSQMIAKDTVKSRIDRPEQGISYAEFSYMLLQATDFLHLFDHHGCTLQMGASDQWGNITMGVELIRKVRRQTAYALTSPLVLRADGTKFGKSEQGALYLSANKTSAWELYQYFVRVEDSIVGTYLRYFSFLEHDAIRELDEVTAAHPERREAQRRLAFEVVALVHSEEDARRVEDAAGALYSEDVAKLDESTLLMVFADAPASEVSRDALMGPGLDLVEVLADSGLAASRSQARTLLSQGGVSVNNRKVSPDETRLGAADLLCDRYVVLRRGRRDFHLLPRLVSAQLPRWIALAFLAVAGLALSGCATNHGSLASQVRAWANTAGYQSNAAQVESDLGDLATGQREHRLLDLRTACEGFGADVYAIYGELPTPDTTITDELGNSMQTFYNAARNCYDASSFSSRDFKTYERQLAEAKSEFAKARTRLARDGIR